MREEHMTRVHIMSTSTPIITRPPLPAAEHLIPRDNGGYGCHEVATVGGCGEFTRRVWRHLHRDTDGIRIEFDATIDGLADASSNGLGDDPQRLQLASVAWALGDVLAEYRARERHPAGAGVYVGLTRLHDTRGAPPGPIRRGLRRTWRRAARWGSRRTRRPWDSPHTVLHATNRHRHGSANTDLANLVVSPPAVAVDVIIRPDQSRNTNC
jgi:hypothetical protein